MNNNIFNLIPDEMRNCYVTLKNLKDKNEESKYNFMNDNLFSELKDPIKASEIYWLEMLYRIHIIVLITSFKTVRWIDSLSSNSNNYYGFCASLRGLIESMADTFYTLNSIPLTIANDFWVIKYQIEKSSNVLITHGPLESVLLHYIQATKLSKEEKLKYPQSFNSKQIKDYLDSVELESVNILYSYLCGITHPAYESNKLFLFLNNYETIVNSHCESMELIMIENLIKENYETLSKLSKIYMNNLMLCMFLLNEFKITELSFDITNENEFKKNEFWNEVKQLIESSKSKYEKAIITGKYD
jgi:hypothetical protein